MHKFFDDVRNGDLPDYIFIEPNYFKGEQNDDHPPHATMRAQRLLASVYNALHWNRHIWDSTLLVVLYDEHGGFFDHISPPPAPSPDQHHEEYTFDRFGVRVPALLISPWVDRGVVPTEFDHTSLLRYLTDKWGLEPLTNRVRDANTFANAIRTSGEPRVDTPESVPVPPLVMMIAENKLPRGAASDATVDELAEPDNDLQRSLKVFAEHLEQNEIPVEARAITITPDGPLQEEQRAKLKVLAFLVHQKAKAGVAQR